MNELMDLSRHLPTVLGVMAGLGVAYVAYHLVFTGPRLQREVLAALGGAGYSPIPANDPGLSAAIRAQAPHRIHEILDAGEDPSVRCKSAVVRIDGDRARYVLTAWRSYRYRRAEGGKANCLETIVLETMDTAAAGPFHVNTFAPDRTATTQGRVAEGLDERFASEFFVYADSGPSVNVPVTLQAAFSDVAPAFLGGIRPTASFPRQPLNTRFTSSGWGLCCDVLMDHAQMAELLRVADRLSEAARRT